MKWNEMNLFQRVLYVVGIICSGTAFVLCVLSIADVLNNGLAYALLLLSVNNLIYGIGNWKKQRGLAIFYFTVGAFLIISQIYILLIK